MKQNSVLEIVPSVQWIGVLDHDLVTFDVIMTTEYGSTYNSYFIDAEKKAIIETTKENFWDDYEEKIRSVVNPEEIEYIILNHTEPDHSGNLKNLLQIAPNAKVVATTTALRYLKDMLGKDFDSIAVKDGHTLDLGNKTLRFISAPNLHWPDTMYTYLEEDKLLFTCDSFGCHFADDRMFDDKVNDFNDAFHYYFDVIIKPFSKFMLKAIEKIDSLEISAICPGHGPIHRENWKQIIELTKVMSEEFLTQPQKNRVFVPFVSAYHKTGDIADQIAAGLKNSGDIEVELMDIEQTHLGELEMKLTQCNALLVGSPTINQNILLPIYRLFSVVNPYRDHGKLAGAFGSYGWSGENKDLLLSNLKSLKFKVLDEGIFVKFDPSEDEKRQAYEYGINFGKELMSRVGE
ncbi:MAG: FprA family A-type flavoprotein [Bacteroidales bacterium]|nr:FprA family A-type flavoprotein [Bacteroidales bacterium]